MTDTTDQPIIPTPAWTDGVRRRFWVDRGPDRIKQAIALRKRGHTYQSIADRLGYADRMSAYYAVNGSIAAQEERARQTRRRSRLRPQMLPHEQRSREIQAARQRREAA